MKQNKKNRVSSRINCVARRRRLFSSATIVEFLSSIVEIVGGFKCLQVSLSLNNTLFY